MEGASDFGEVLDEPLVEVHKSYEGLDVLYFHQLWPVHDSLDFNRVQGYTVFGDDEPKVVHLSTLSQLAMGCVTCHACHSCVTDFRPILGNPVEVTHVTSLGLVYSFPC